MKIIVDTAVTLPVNVLPLTDDTDFKTREVAIAFDAAGMDLVWNFVTTAGVQTQTAITPTTAGDYDWTHVGDGMYKIELPASGGVSVNNDTEGYGWFTGVATGVLSWCSPIFEIVPASVANSLVNGTDNLQTDLVQWLGTAPLSLSSQRVQSHLGAGDANVLTASLLATDAVEEIRNAITGGAYALSTDVNGRTRIVDGTGAGELDTLLGTVLLRSVTQASIDAIEADTNELQVDWVNGGRLDLLIDAIKAKTDGLNFTGSNILALLADGVTHGGTTALMRLGAAGATPAFYVTNSLGDATKFESTGGNGHGFSQQGNGSGAGTYSVAGATGKGIVGLGGSTSGSGIYGEGRGQGATSAGMELRNFVSTDGWGMYVTGSNKGVQFEGGATAFRILGLTTITANSRGLHVSSKGNLDGVTIDGGSTGNGASIAGGSVSGDALLLSVISGDGIDTPNLKINGVNHVPQTGDNFARLGAPAGASVSADIAALKLLLDTTGVVVNDHTSAALTELRTSLLGGDWDLDTDVNGRVRIVDGTGAGELDTALGLVKISGTLQTLDALDTAQDVEHDATQAAIAALNNPSAAQIASAVLTTQLTESYAADAVVPTLTQGLLAIHQLLMNFEITGLNYNVLKFNGTAAFTADLNDATNPTSLRRAA